MKLTAETLAAAACALAVGLTITAPPAAAGPACRTVKAVGCSTTQSDDSPENPRSVKGHKSGKQSVNDGKTPAIRR